MSGRDLLHGLAGSGADLVFAVPGHGSALPVLVFGQLVALADEGRCPLVAYEGMPSAAAVRARSLVDLCGRHIGQTVALMFEMGEPMLPVVTGLLQGTPGWPQADLPAQVEIEAGGSRMIVSARQELVLRCGKASITLTADGRVEIRGETIRTQAIGANRICGGSVELN